MNKNKALQKFLNGTAVEEVELLKPETTSEKTFDAIEKRIKESHDTSTTETTIDTKRAEEALLWTRFQQQTVALG